MMNTPSAVALTGFVVALTAIDELVSGHSADTATAKGVGLGKNTDVGLEAPESGFAGQVTEVAPCSVT